MGFQLVPKLVTLMTLNGVIALILLYSTAFGSFGSKLHQSG